ncbi:hypothetical protein SKAU_G00145900 [Synaphobranchus kaupii]|uniref:Uncharacterized protein n=1 Tax=Synaphobranchus kaupii TaxID=118154 RepID=A0A9Q1FTJ1_SYNKA|nr:hypothetical protein SKAU_G00145900 [Synaphobranchus kaupii]
MRDAACRTTPKFTELTELLPRAPLNNSTAGGIALNGSLSPFKRAPAEPGHMSECSGETCKVPFDPARASPAGRGKDVGRTPKNIRGSPRKSVVVAGPQDAVGSRVCRKTVSGVDLQL